METILDEASPPDRPIRRGRAKTALTLKLETMIPGQRLRCLNATSQQQRQIRKLALYTGKRLKEARFTTRKTSEGHIDIYCVAKQPAKPQGGNQP